MTDSFLALGEETDLRNEVDESYDGVVAKRTPPPDAGQPQVQRHALHGTRHI